MRAGVLRDMGAGYVLGRDDASAFVALVILYAVDEPSEPGISGAEFVVKTDSSLTCDSLDVALSLFVSATRVLPSLDFPPISACLVLDKTNSNRPQLRTVRPILAGWNLSRQG